MVIKTSAIILCAGIGSRMGFKEGINKCAIPINNTSAIKHTVTALIQSDIQNIVIVIGYASDSVKDALKTIKESDRITYAENPYFDYHGCNYSLACASNNEKIISSHRLIIAEGDSLLNPTSMQKIINSDYHTSSLIRDTSYIDYTRSVTAVGENKKIMRYEYDTAHTGLPPDLKQNESIIGESMQLWSFSGNTLQHLLKLLQIYKDTALKSNTACLHSGVYSINQLGAQDNDLNIEPIESDVPDDWINLNTVDDLEKAKTVQWLLK